MDRKKIAAFIGIVAITALLLIIRSGDPGREKGYIIDKSYKIPVDSIMSLRKRIDEPNRSTLNMEVSDVRRQGTLFQDPSLDIGGFLSGGLVNHDTLRYLRFLHKKFRSSIDTSGHLEEVRNYLFSNLPENEAEAMHRLYDDYLACEMDLMERSQLWDTPKEPEDSIDILRRMQDFRRERLGDQVADTLFGAEVKSREYAIRRAMIVYDDEMFGGEKEELIETLNSDIWGEETAAIEELPKPYNRYREKLAIYTRDFEEMTSPAEKSALTREFREMFFTAHVVERFEEVDRKLDKKKATETEYLLAKEEILQDPDLTQDEKSMNIGTLQDAAFGDAAAALRRREAMEKGLERLKAGEDNT